MRTRRGGGQKIQDLFGYHLWNPPNSVEPRLSSLYAGARRVDGPRGVDGLALQRRQLPLDLLELELLVLDLIIHINIINIVL